MAARSSFQLGRLHVEQSILGFPSLYYVFQRVFSEHWRKEAEKLKGFLWGVWTVSASVAALSRQSRAKFLGLWQAVMTCWQKPTWSWFVAYWERSFDICLTCQAHAQFKRRGPPEPGACAPRASARIQAVHPWWSFNPHPSCRINQVGLSKGRKITKHAVSECTIEYFWRDTCLRLATSGFTFFQFVTKLHKRAQSDS